MQVRGAYEWQDRQDAACRAEEHMCGRMMLRAGQGRVRVAGCCMQGSGAYECNDVACRAGECTSVMMLHAWQVSVRVTGYAGCCM